MCNSLKISLKTLVIVAMIGTRFSMRQQLAQALTCVCLFPKPSCRNVSAVYDFPMLMRSLIWSFYCLIATYRYRISILPKCSLQYIVFAYALPWSWDCQRALCTVLYVYFRTAFAFKKNACESCLIANVCTIWGSFGASFRFAEGLLRFFGVRFGFLWVCVCTSIYRIRRSRCLGSGVTTALRWAHIANTFTCLCKWTD